MENKNGELLEFIALLLELFNDNNAEVDDLLDRRFEDEFKYYGFEATSYPFAEKYKISNEYEALSLLDQVDDIQCLGSMIFAWWRHFEHWADPSQIYVERNWFVATLTKLKELVGKQSMPKYIKKEKNELCIENNKKSVDAKIQIEEQMKN